MKWPEKSTRAFCVSCDRTVDAKLTRATRTVYGEEVPDLLAYACETCHAVVEVPSVSSGRIQAVKAARSNVGATEFRFSHEALDLAFCVHAALGAMPIREPFAIPLRIGLSVAHAMDAPASDWKLIDGFEQSVRARPVLSQDTVRRIDALAGAWGAESRASIARWLVVAAYEAVVLRGFAAERPREHTVMIPTHEYAPSPFEMSALRAFYTLTHATTEKTSAKPSKTLPMSEALWATEQ